MSNIVVLDDIEKNFETYLSTENDEHKLSLLKCITKKFMVCSNLELDELNEEGKNILASMKELSKADIETFYEYAIKKINNFSKEIEFVLPCIPNDKTTEFTKKINRYLKRKNDINDDVLKKYIDSDEDNMTKFKAYYIMFTFHHDKKNVQKCKNIVETYGSLFSGYPLWHYTKSQMLYQEEREHKNPNMSKAIEAAKKCISIYEDNDDYDKNYPGIYHNFCELVYNAFELKDKSCFSENLEYAKKCIETAIFINENFAKYYYTKGRLLMAESVVTRTDYFDDAENFILKAIDKEDSSNDNYALKIIDYETALLRCKTERRLKEIDVAIKNAEDTQKEIKKLQAENEKREKAFDDQLKDDEKNFQKELENQKKETLEVLGFFSGIISLIVVTSQVVLNLDMISASVIMLLFLGTMIIAFSFFHFVVLNGERKKEGLIVGYIAAGIIIIAVALGIAIYNTGNIKGITENNMVINETDTESAD